MRNQKFLHFFPSCLLILGIVTTAHSQANTISCAELYPVQTNNQKLQKFMELTSARPGTDAFLFNLQAAGLKVDQTDQLHKGHGSYAVMGIRDSQTGERYTLIRTSTGEGFWASIGRYLVREEIQILNLFSQHPNIIKPIRTSQENAYLILKSGQPTLAEFVARLKRQSQVRISDIAEFFKYFEQLVSTLKDFHDQGLLMVDLDAREMFLDNGNLFIASLTSVMKIDQLSEKKAIGINRVSAPQKYLFPEGALLLLFKARHELETLTVGSPEHSAVLKRISKLEAKTRKALRRIGKAGDLHSTADMMRAFRFAIQDKLPNEILSELSEFYRLLEFYETKFIFPDLENNSVDTAEALQIARAIKAELARLQN